jgi:lysophospholipase L1-like esterase
VLDIWSDFVNKDGSIKEELFMADKIHPNKDGYEVYASRLRPILKQVLK